MTKRIIECITDKHHADVISRSLSQADIDVLVNRLLGFVDSFEEMA